MNGGVEGFLRGGIVGSVAGLLFCDEVAKVARSPANVPASNGTSSFRVWLANRKRNWCARGRSAVQYACALACWNFLLTSGSCFATRGGIPYPVDAVIGGSLGGYVVSTALRLSVYPRLLSTLGSAAFSVLAQRPAEPELGDYVDLNNHSNEK